MLLIRILLMCALRAHINRTLLIIIFLTFVKEKKEKKNWWRMPWNLLPKEEDCESVSQEEADVHRTIFCFLKFCLLL